MTVDEFIEMQAVLDGKTLITYHKVNGNVLESEDMMSIPTSVTNVTEEVEFAIAA